jgi:ankyrin repeat protein
MEIMDHSHKPNIFLLAKYNHYIEVKKLIELNKDLLNINDRDDNGLTALHICATYGSFETAVLLLNQPLIQIHLPGQYFN